MSGPPAEASISSTEPANKISEWLISTIKHDIDDRTTQDDKKQNLIQRVVSKRSEDAEEYEPRVVSIGPIHHGKPHLKAMEEKKWSFLGEYVRQKVETFDITPSFVEVMLRSRDHYSHSDHSAYDERAWCMMMFLDTLFIFSFIDNYISMRWSTLDMKNQHLVHRDLLLSENQLPFEVLLEFSKNNIAFDISSIVAFLLTQLILTVDVLSPRDAASFFKHLLRTFVGSPQPVSHEHLLQLFRDIWINAHDTSALGVIVEETASGIEYVDYQALSVTELKKVGIRCSLGKDHLYHFSPSDICFIPSKLSGELFLPRLGIHEWTESLLLNIVAHEYSSSNSDKSLVISSYLNFMAMLIIQEEDVKELRARGVIGNLIGSDQAVVDFFKDIKANLVTYNPRAFRPITEQIATYTTSKRHTLRVVLAEFKQRYFGGPWNFLVFLAVIFTVAMTILQTIFTAIQTYK